ncbi:MAG: methyltransferase regulatory domain-containing protein [Planctomycetota bacterium]|jgi:methyltransferase-like protein/SAM-dependent methyltransferase
MSASTPPANQATVNPYDEVPYHSRCFIQTHPQRLAFIGRLFGMDPAKASNCRVLELGSASGGNLIPLALRYPQSQFLGLDYAEVQVIEGKKQVEALGLKNLEIRQADLGEYDVTKDGKFDYIICHGVYSWVPPHVQHAILKICGQALTPQGIAYISYNCYPGWKMREIIRDAMNYHAGSRPTALERVQQSRAIINFITEISEADSAFGKILHAEADLLKQASDDYLLHEHLEVHNSPCYFKDFINLSLEQGLNYLGEAQIEEMIPHHLGPKVMDALNRVSGGNILAIEQYLDFFRNRRFRRTLLVHKDIAGKLARNISPENVSKFHFAGAYKIEGDAPLHEAKEQKFTDGENRNLTSTQPFVKAMMLALNDHWPHTYTAAEWKAAAEARLKAHPECLVNTDALFNEVLIRGFANGMVHVVDEVVDLGKGDAVLPMVTPLVLARAKANNREVSNQWHQTVNLNDLQIAICQLVDGTRDIKAIKAELVKKCVDGQFRLAKDNVPITDKNTIELLLEQILPQALKELERLALLI